LQRRGMIVLTCHTAVEEQARAIVKRGFAPAGMTATDVAGDILTHLISGALVVPSMVATIAVLQSRYGYAYLTPL
jgi:intracellular sulfur oxidation DsrE/DsrF family protein